MGIGALTLGYSGATVTARPDISIRPETDMRTRCNNREMAGVSGAEGGPRVVTLVVLVMLIAWRDT